jgi:prepilin-type N-terminal cleavage/methylation domain-containing protein
MTMVPPPGSAAHAARSRRGDAGFTLVELLIVVVVLGVLSAIVLFGVGRFRADANTAACQADVSAVNAAADAYDAVTGRYPSEMAQLTLGQYLKSAPSSGTFTFDATSRTAVRTPACGGTPVATGGVPPTLSSSSATAPTTPAPTATAPATTGRCVATVAIDNSWPQGYQAAVTVTNTGPSTLSPWTATWTVPAGVTLTNGWSATLSQSGALMTAEAPSWNISLATGASWTVGFIADGPFSPPPSDIRLNGVRCG